MRDVMLVALGGAAGSAARWVFGSWAATRYSPAFPWPTLTINILGAFLLGVLMALHLGGRIADPRWVLLLGIGVLGGFTTFSTLSYEALTLLQRGALAGAAIYAIGSAVAGVISAFAGVLFGRAL